MAGTQVWYQAQVGGYGRNVKGKRTRPVITRDDDYLMQKSDRDSVSVSGSWTGEPSLLVPHILGLWAWFNSAGAGLFIYSLRFDLASFPIPSMPSGCARGADLQTCLDKRGRRLCKQTEGGRHAVSPNFRFPQALKANRNRWVGMTRRSVAGLEFGALLDAQLASVS